MIHNVLYKVSRSRLEGNGEAAEGLARWSNNSLQNIYISMPL